MRKIASTLLIAAATAAAGPLTIQTQETTWTNGLDTITFAALTAEGPGVVPIVSYDIEIANDTSLRSFAFPLFVDAAAGDSAVPVSLRFDGTFGINASGQYVFILGILHQRVDNGAGDGSGILVAPSGSVNRTGAVGQAITGTLNAHVGIAAPEPGAYALMGFGLVLFALRAYARHVKIHNSKRGV